MPVFVTENTLDDFGFISVLSLFHVAVVHALDVGYCSSSNKSE